MAQIALIPSMASPAAVGCPGSLYLPILPISILARCCYHYNRQTREEACPLAAQAAPEKTACFSFDTHMMSCFETMVKIGGYIMLFSILLCI